MLKGFVRRGLFVGLVVSSCLAVILVVYGLTQQEEGDSTRPEFKFVRVKIGMRTPEDLQYLKAMGIECPKSGECVVIITEADRRQIEKAGLKAKALTGLRPDKGPNQVEYKLVREIDLEKEKIGGIVFGQKSTTRPAMPQMAQRDYREILFYSPDFSLVNTYKQSERYTDVFPSKNLEYVGILTPLKIPTKDTIGKVKFTLINNKGEKLWEMEEKTYYDMGGNGYSISNNGIVVERDHKNGILTFYDQKGSEIKKIQLYAGTWDPGGQGIRSEFSENGEYLLIQAADEDGHAFGEGIGVLFFTSDGKELWRFNTEDKGMGAKNISKLNNYVAVSTKGTTYLLSREGNQIRKFESLFATGICFSSDEKYTLVTEHYHTCYLILSENGEVMFKYRNREPLGYIYSSEIAEDARMFGLISGFGGESIQLFLIGFDGGKVWSTNFSPPGGPLFRTVNLSMSHDGKRIAVQIGPKLMIYQRVE